ncbi:mucoidy inhibitor MuiA family protein [bacterium]|nr:mucoidy inhibitor MuiA family protein [bacterium]
MNLSRKKNTQLQLFLIFLTAFLFSPFLYTTKVAASDDKAPKEVELKTKIVETTVYRKDDVRIIRRGKIEVTTGLYKLICTDFPSRTSSSSIQVEGNGSAEAKITGIDIRDTENLYTKSPEYNKLLKDLEKLNLKEDSLAIQQKSLNKRLKFVLSLSNFSLESANEELARESFDIKDWQNLLNFIENENTSIENKISDIRRKSGKIKENIQSISLKLNNMRVSKKGKEVIIDCEVMSAGDLTINFSYLVGFAAWTPEYVLRYNKLTQTIDLSYKALVEQKSGENWENVYVLLSTARPHLGAAPPKLTPSYIRTRPIYPSISRMSNTKNVNESLAMKSSIIKTSDELHVRGGRDHSINFSLEETETSKSGFSANFAIKNPISISSGATRRVLIKRVKIPVELSLYSCPRLSEHTFAAGKITNTMDIPILEGTGGIYVETKPSENSIPITTFVGNENILSAASGEKITVHLGIDQDIKVKHKLEKREYLSKKKNKRTEIRYHYTITAENFKKHDVELTIEDRLPVSTMDDIDVDDIDIKPQPDTRRDDGIITWKLPLKNGEKINISIEYTIKFPGDWPESRIINLE